MFKFLRTVAEALRRAELKVMTMEFGMTGWSAVAVL